MEKAAHSALLINKNLMKHMTEFLEKNEAHKILDSLKEGKYVQMNLINLALKATGELIEVNQAPDEPAVSSGHGSNRARRSTFALQHLVFD